MPPNSSYYTQMSFSQSSALQIYSVQTLKRPVQKMIHMPNLHCYYSVFDLENTEAFSIQEKEKISLFPLFSPFLHPLIPGPKAFKYSFSAFQAGSRLHPTFFFIVNFTPDSELEPPRESVAALLVFARPWSSSLLSFLFLFQDLEIEQCLCQCGDLACGLLLSGSGEVWERFGEPNLLLTTVTMFQCLDQHVQRCLIQSVLSLLGLGRNQPI